MLATRNISRVQARGTYSRAFSASANCSKERLVILGSGWGSYEVLRGIDKKRWDVTVVSPNSYFNFTPLLASCSVGTLELRCATEPVRRYAPQITSYQAWCDSIDFKNKTLKCVSIILLLSHMTATSSTTTDRSQTPSPSYFPQTDTPPPATNTEFTISYDRLVIGVGAYSQTFNTPGVKEHALFLKDVRDARAIRARILDCFEQANQPTLSDIDRRNLLNFCIVGGGPTGVEFAAELHDLIHAEIQSHYPTLARMARITLYDVAPSILGMFDRELIHYTENTLRREGVRLRTGHHVERVERDRMIVTEQGEVPFGLLVWSTGLAPNPLVSAITELQKGKKSGRCIQVDSHLNAIRADGTPDPNIWVIGDAAQLPDVALPATAQVANQQAKYLTRQLNRIAKDKSVDRVFEFHNMGSLAYIGNWKAIYDRSQNGNGDKPAPFTKETGRLAWLLWRSAYFTRTLSIRNKILVPFYWFLNWIFGRDLTRF
ncbi:pyridine nucleotide-disulfide oxidoreductase-domain-containing protein [Schizophyllum fasciatum]